MVWFLLVEKRLAWTTKDAYKLSVDIGEVADALVRCPVSRESLFGNSAWRYVRSGFPGCVLGVFNEFLADPMSLLGMTWVKPE